MKTYSVIFKKTASKKLENLPKMIQQKILDAVDLLALNPNTQLLQTKKLKGEEALYRLRIQDYRVIYTIEHHKITIIVVKIGHRKEVYRH